MHYMRGKVCQTEASEPFLHFSVPTKPRRQETNLQEVPKIQMSIKRLISHLATLSNQLDIEYDSLLSNSISPSTKLLLRTNFFRFHAVFSVQELQARYAATLQCVQILSSRLRNGQKLTETIYVSDEQDFLKMFRLYFSKPYTLLEQAQMRKVLSVLWEAQKMPTHLSHAGNLKLWMHGISLPVHPNLNRLHRAAIECAEDIGQIAKMKSGIYCGVNEADALALTPFMVAAIVQNKTALCKLVKYGAEVGSCPLVCRVAKGKKGGKGRFRRDWGREKRMQYDGMEILRRNKREDLIGDVFYEMAVGRVRRFGREGKGLREMMEKMPDCAFQIDWREQKKLLSMKRVVKDVVLVNKKGNRLRIDYHQEGIEECKPINYSLLLDCTQKELAFHLLRNHSKEILNLMKEVDLDAVRDAFVLYMREGNVMNRRLKAYEGSIEGQNHLHLQWETVYQNITQATDYAFKTVPEYISTIMKSDCISYSKMQDEERAIQNQDIVKIDSKIKSKESIQSNALQIIHKCTNGLNFSSVDLILRMVSFVYSSSGLLDALRTAVKIVMTECPMVAKTAFPHGARLTYQGRQIWAEVKNVSWKQTSQEVFRLEQKAVDFHYAKTEEDEHFLKKLEETLYVDEVSSIRASMYLQGDQEEINFNDMSVNE